MKTQLKFNCLAMMATDPSNSPSSSSSSTSSPAFADDFDPIGLCFAVHLCVEQVLLSYATVFDVPIYAAARRKKRGTRSRSCSPSRRHPPSEHQLRRPFAAICDELLQRGCVDGTSHARLLDLHAWSGGSAAGLVQHGLNATFAAGLRNAVAALIEAVNGYYALIRVDVDEVCLVHPHSTHSTHSTQLTHVTLGVSGAPRPRPARVGGPAGPPRPPRVRARR